MKDKGSPSLLRRAAERARNNSFYLASALAAYQESENLDDEALAEFLGCAPSALPSLALCRQPGAVGEAEFRNDVEQLIARFNVRLDSLVQLLREAEFLEALRSRPPTSTRIQTDSHAGLLLAAQDRSEGVDKQDQETSEGDPERDASEEL
jgi:hypothetical protein